MNILRNFFRKYLTPAAIAVLIALLIVVTAKVIEADFKSFSFFKLFKLIGKDIAVYTILLTCLHYFQSRNRAVFNFLFYFAISTLILSIINAANLITTGEQLSLQTLIAGQENLAVIFKLFVDVGGIALIIILPAFFLLLIFLHHKYPSTAQRTFLNHTAISSANVALCIFMFFMANQNVRAKKAAEYQNFLVQIASDIVSFQRKGNFEGYKNKLLIPDDQISLLKQKDRPNIIYFIYESTRYSFTSLKEGVQTTPNLKMLSELGINTTNARPVLPHTSKSIFSMICGRTPLLQRVIYETSDNFDAQCLPAALNEAGYETAFFQSAYGLFEGRPRLARNMGFKDFYAQEDFDGERLGFIAADDMAMKAPLEKWIKSQSAEKPFLLTVLTSAMHFPYKLPAPDAKSRWKAGTNYESKERSKFLIERADMLLGHLIQTLKDNNLYNNTIIVAAADHGEGFGNHGIKMHDNNYFEDGLHVPLVITGPNVPKVTVQENSSLMDVVPTILDILDISPTPGSLEGISLLQNNDPQRKVWFSCWLDERCHGYVKEDHKLVYEKTSDATWYSNFRKNEKERLQLTEEMKLEFDNITDKIFNYRNFALRPVFKGSTEYNGRWICPEFKRDCTHING
jgi:arylsulfatase A-like enzyme